MAASTIHQVALAFLSLVAGIPWRLSGSLLPLHILFRNVSQVALWRCEILGQISDGHWSNEEMGWELWHEARVSIDQNNPHCTVRAPVPELEELLPILQDRMTAYMEITRSMGLDFALEQRHFVTVEGGLHHPLYDNLSCVVTYEELSEELKDMQNILKNQAVDR